MAGNLEFAAIYNSVLYGSELVLFSLCSHDRGMPITRAQIARAMYDYMFLIPINGKKKKKKK